MADARTEFSGAKLMLFAGPRLVVLRRDQKPNLVWPGCLDFPGGGREHGETPEVCAVRETWEELGLRVAPDRLRLAHLRTASNQVGWFFAAHLPESVLQDVRMGDEGQGWLAMTPDAYLSDSDSIPHFRAILAGYLQRLAWSAR